MFPAMTDLRGDSQNRKRCYTEVAPADQVGQRRRKWGATQWILETSNERGGEEKCIVCVGENPKGNRAVRRLDMENAVATR